MGNCWDPSLSRLQIELKENSGMNQSLNSTETDDGPPLNHQFAVAFCVLITFYRFAKEINVNVHQTQDE